MFADRVFAIDTENAFKMGPHIAEVEVNGHQVIKLNLGEPDFNTPDFIKEEIKRQLDLNNTHYCDPKGLLSLREAIAAEIYQTRGITTSPEHIVVFPGAKPGIGFSQAIYCNPGDEVIYPSPGFPIYESFIRYLGAIPKPLFLKEEAGFTFSAEDLAPLITSKTKLIFLNFPSNPTGGIASLDQLTDISRVILEKAPDEARVYSDEIYEHIIFDNKKHHSIASIPGMQSRTIISSGFSKSYAWTGGRIGYAVLPSHIDADMFKNLNINYFSCVSPYNQEAARIALTHPDAQKYIKHMTDRFEERCRHLVQNLNTIPGVHCEMPKGAFYAFPNIREGLETLGVFEAFQTLDKSLQNKTSPSTLFQMFALYYHYVSVLDRRSFGKIGAEHQHFLRVSATVDLPLLTEGVKRLRNAFSDRAGFLKFMQSHHHLFS